MAQGLWLPLLWARTSLDQESAPATPATGGPRWLRAPPETSQTESLIQSPLSRSGTWGGGALQGALLCHRPCLPHTPDPMAVLRCWEESQALGWGGGMPHLCGAPRLHVAFPKQETKSPFDR